MTDRYKKNLDYIYSTIVNAFLLFVAFCFSLNLLRVLHLASSNRYGIETLSKFHAESSFPVLIGIVVITIIGYLVLSKLRRRNSRIVRYLIILFLLCFYFIGVIAPNLAHYEGNADAFHNGEQLAPALALEQGKTPYKDLFFLHGAGEDVYTPWLSFKMFGQSIGSYYLLTGLLQLISTGLFLLLLHKLFKNDAVFYLVALWFMSSSFAAFYYIRDIPVWLSLILLYDMLVSKRFNNIGLAALGFLASFSLFYSFDRGIFLSGLLFVVAAILVLYSKVGNEYKLRPTLSKDRLVPIAFAAGGYLLSLALWGLTIGWDGIKAFISTSMQVAKYQGILFNYPYPVLSKETLMQWLPIIALISLGIVFYFKIRETKLKTIQPVLLFEVIVFLFALLFFRAATGRPDLGHVAYGSVMTFLLLFYVAWNGLHALLSSNNFNIQLIPRYLLPTLFVITLAISTSITNYYWLIQMNQAPLYPVKLALTAPKKADTFWTNDEYEAVVKYIRNNTTKNDALFVLPSEPMLYYSTGLRNPTKFSITWFADPSSLESELLTELKQTPPKLVVYKAGIGFYDEPDYVEITKRLPNVNKWILDNYHTSHSVGQYIILTR